MLLYANIVFNLTIKRTQLSSTWIDFRVRNVVLFVHVNSDVVVLTNKTKINDFLRNLVNAHKKKTKLKKKCLVKILERFNS